MDTWKCFVCEAVHPIDHVGQGDGDGLMCCLACDPNKLVRVIKISPGCGGPWLGFDLSHATSESLGMGISELVASSEPGDDYVMSVEDLPVVEVAQWKEFDGF